MKKKLLIATGVLFCSLVAFVLSLFLYKNEIIKEDILSGIGSPGDRWEIDAPKGQFEYVEFIKGEKGSGLRSAKNAHIKNVSYKKDKTIIYDVDYYYDSFGKRIVLSEKKPSATRPENYAIFFGCSDLLGIGLNSIDTIPALFESGTENYKAYNFGFIGAGVHYVNRMLESVNLAPEISEKKGVIIYVVTEGHYPKTLGKLGPLIRPVMPFYALQNGEPKYQGTLSEVQPLMSQIKKYLALNWVSTLLGGSFITENMKYTAEEKELVCKLLKATQVNSKKQFPESRFIVFLHTMLPGGDRDRLKECGVKNNIEIADFNIPWDDRFDSDPVYFHPTKLINELATTRIINYLNENK